MVPIVTDALSPILLEKSKLCDKAVWQPKAMAFVVRSHRHLWGKNNEDPQAFLFTRGLKNQFMKNLLLGWNKFGQERPIENWGFKTDSQTGRKLFLPSGIVVPFIVEKQLQSIFIHPYDENKTQKTTIVPGSLSSTLVLGEKKEKIAIVQHLLDGLFLFQETDGSYCVMVHPDPHLSLDHHLKSIITNAGSVSIFCHDKDGTALNKKLFPGIPSHCFYAYQSKEELKKMMLRL